MGMRMWNRWATFALFALVTTAGCGAEPESEPASQAPADTPQATQQQPATPPAGGQQAMGPLPEGVTPQMVQQGQQIFTSQATCYTCHGMDATGTPLAPNLTDDEWINIDGSYDAIIELVRTGVPEPVEHPAPMPPMGGAQLSEEQIRSVAAYVYSISHG